MFGMMGCSLFEVAFSNSVGSTSHELRWSAGSLG